MPIAKRTIWYTPTDFIAPGETFDPAEKGLSGDDMKALLKNGDIQASTEVLKSPVDAKTTRPNVQDTLAAIAAVQTIEELEKLAEGEDRKGVLPAIEARRAELAPLQ